jgi:hypothetical protein
VRDELLDGELFYTLTEAQVMVGDWREDYNERRPHSALAMKAPARFARTWVADRDALDVSLRSPYGLAPADVDFTTLQPEPSHRLSEQVDP